MRTIDDVERRADGGSAPTMRAVVARGAGGPEVLEIVEVPVAEPGAGEVRIRVAAATVNPIDLSARAGRLAAGGLMTSTFAVPLGWDVAGHVEATGPGVRRFSVGDAVVGLRDLLDAPGTHAETVVLDERAVAPAPRSVPLEVAATLPLDGLTADGALRRTGARAGDRVLVTGAGGGVGGFVLQLAALRGIETVAVVRPGTEHRVRHGSAAHVVASGDSLGATVRAVVRGGVDAVIDAAVLGIEAHATLRAGGTFVALVRPFAPPPLRGTSVVVHEVSADGARLTELAALVDLGVLELGVPDVVALSAAADAHARLDAGGTGRRIVLSPSDPGAPR